MALNYVGWISGCVDPQLNPLDTKLGTPKIPFLEELDLLDTFK